MSAETCQKCARLRIAVEKLEDEVAQLYAALKKCTADNLQLRKQLESWADDFDGQTLSPDSPVKSTNETPGVPARFNN